MARNFIGKVTRHSEKAGVTLRARVTSPSGKVTAYKDFKCMVKSSGLSDEQAVITDLNYISNNLLANGVTGVKHNLTTYMPKKGPNETDVTYTVIGENIMEYFNSDGVVIKRPAYGEPAVVGSLYIYVTKNTASAGREITISIDPYNISEVKESIADVITWEKIRGLNWAESSDEATNGPSNVIYPLRLMDTIDSGLMTKPISVTWEIKSDSLEAALGQERIEIKPGEESPIYRPAYYDMYEARQSYYAYQNSMTMCQSKIESSVSKTYMRLGGLVLVAKFEINDTVNSTVINDSVTFNLKTLSAAVTNEEVALYVQSIISNFEIKDLTYNQVFSTNSGNDGVGSSKTVYYDTKTTNASVLDLYTKNDVINMTKNNPFTNESSGIKIAAITWTVIAPETMDTTPAAVQNQLEYSKDGLSTSSLDTSENLTFTLNPQTEPLEKRLIFRAVISISQYDNKAQAGVTSFYWFNCVNSEAITGSTTDTPEEDESV